MPRVNLIQVRGGTAAAWVTANPVLALREQGIETDTLYMKIGDGVTAWTSLLYASVSKAYVDALSLGIVNSWKAPVSVASTANLTLSGEQTIDGILTSASRILVKNQIAQSENGIYVTAAGAWARSSDANVAAELEGVAVIVQQGTVGANSTWIQTTDNITLGSSNIVWAQPNPTVPDASSIEKGIAKLYAVTGTNEDGSMTQDSITDELALKSDILVSFRTLTASHTLDATDLASVNAGDVLKIKMNVATANTVTIPLNATQAFPVGSAIIIQQIGAGQTSIAVTGGVTANSANGWVKIAYQFASVVLTKTATDTWDIEGTLTA